MLRLRYPVRFTPVRHLLRGLGFELLNAFFRSWIAPEEPKPVLRHSRWIALSRCAIHILPCGVFAFLIFLNFNVTYIGPGFSYTQSNGIYLALFQVAAKVLELACVASLTTVVLHVLRHDLMNDGVPLGFVGSGVFFSQANCLWSPEMFAGGLQSIKSWRLIRLLFVISAAAIIAVLIAPASAVLLQPRPQQVPAGGTEYFLPATPDELWPSMIDGSDELPECFDGFDRRRILCASGGFESLRAYFEGFNSSMVVSLPMQGYVNPRAVTVQSPSVKIPSFLITGPIFGFNRETTMSQPNAVTAILQEALTQDWYALAHTVPENKATLSSVREYRYAAEYVSSTSTTSPMVGLRCALAQNISTKVFSVNFPVKLWAVRVHPDGSGSTQWDSTELPLNISGSNSSFSNDVQVSWVSLPADRFGPVSGGVLVRFPWEPTTRSQAVIGCSLSASWVATKVFTDSVAGDGAWSVVEQVGVISNITTNLNASSARASRYFRLITLTEKWYRSLTPSTPADDAKNQSRALNTIERLFSDVGLGAELVEQRTQPQWVYNPSTDSCHWRSPQGNVSDVDWLNNRACGAGSKNQLVEWILASVFVNGLSRYGSHRAFNLAATVNGRSDPFKWDLKNPPHAPDFSKSLFSLKPKHNAVLPAPSGSGFVTQRMALQVSGYAWYTSSISDYLALAVVALYMLIAIVYTIHVLFITGVTSSSWDTVTELLALALQSPVPESLNGSGAGIEKLATYRRLVRLKASEQEGDGQEQKLVLIVGDEVLRRKNEGESENDDQGTNVTYEDLKVDQEYL